MSLSKVGRQGFKHLLLIVATSRASAFIAQWVMGLFLLKEDFGIIAIISVVYLLAAGFKEVGLYQILQEYRSDFERRAPSLTASAQLLNLSGVAILLAAAPLIAHHYDDQRLLWITTALVLAMPFNIAALPYKARLAIRFDFKRISRVESASILVSNISLAALAAVGAGIYSYVASQIILTLMTYYMYRHGEQPIALSIRPGRRALSDFVSRSKWLILSSYMNNVATRGDYLVLSLLLSKASLGLYYFSYQLMAAAVQLVGMALNHLLLPLFSAIKNDASRIKAGLRKAGDALSFMTGALCLSLLVWLPFVVRTVWSGKWNEAIPLALLVTIAVPPRLLSSPLGSSALEAMAQYRSRTLLSVADAASLVVFVWIGGLHHGALGACVAIALQRCTAGMLFYFVAARYVGVSMSQAILQLFRHLMPYLVACTALALAVFQVIGYDHFLHAGFLYTLTLFTGIMVLFLCLSHRQLVEYALKR